MGEPDDEELQRAFLMSLQPAPDAKRSKPGDNIGTPFATTTGVVPGESSDARDRRMQRELRAAAAERRMLANKELCSSSLFEQQALSPEKCSRIPQTMFPPHASSKPSSSGKVSGSERHGNPRDDGDRGTRGRRKVSDIGEQLPFHVADQLFTLVFGSNVSKDVLAQWCNQGFRFSPDKETSLGLVQREGGPCGVLAPIQALVLKYLLFVPENESDHLLLKDKGLASNIGNMGLSQKPASILNNEVLEPVLVFTDAQRTRALVQAMAETLWLAGCKQRGVVAVLGILGFQSEDGTDDEEQDELIAKTLEDVTIYSAADLHGYVRTFTCTSMPALLFQLQRLLPGFRSRVGALMFLFSALLSRGLDTIQSDRDDPSQPLVTCPFGHASQEIVNLLLCGQAVSNEFDGNMDLGGGMFLKGIPINVEVGFLTLLESLNLCKVGQYLKHPKWPIWVVGSESHYTVLFAFHTDVQDENELEDREMRIRKTFDAHDQSGGGGFISPGALQHVLHEMNINMPRDMLENVCNTDIVVWNDLWQALHQLDKNSGGLRDPESLSGKKQFELYHFNGIAKTVSNSTLLAGELVHQRPRLTKLRVVVPPRWSPEEFMVECKPKSPEVGMAGTGGSDKSLRGELVSREEPVQHAPLVDCIRTRWQRATCNWSGDPPSIV
eukprot:c24646_g1_i1 orf=494-2491(+)